MSRKIAFFLRAIALGLPRARITARGDGFLRAEFTSRLFRFVDDVEVLVDDTATKLHVRSASRTGYWDFGVNRKRVEELRRRFSSQP